MKRFFLLLFLSLFLVACKKDKVDASSTKAFQESINDMASSLSTLQQVKFNEALYILKTFGVEGTNDIQRLKNLADLLVGKNVTQVMALADSIAQKNGMDWKSTGPPSLGEMNIFGNENATERDPHDVKASSLGLTVTEMGRDSIVGAKSIQVVPRLLDGTGNPVVFDMAGLEAILEVFSNGNRLLTSKNIMMDNKFSGFNIKLANIAADQVVDNKIDVTVTVKTTNKDFKMSKIGINVNAKALKAPAVEKAPVLDEFGNPIETPTTTSEAGSTVSVVSGDPQKTVSKFLGSLNAQNFKAAFDTSDNPAWGSYDNFSNPTSGFGAMKGITVKNIGTPTTNGNSSSVNASYEVKDKDGNTTPLNVTFGLKNVNGEWKISSYKIN